MKTRALTLMACLRILFRVPRGRIVFRLSCCAAFSAVVLLVDGGCAQFDSTTKRSSLVGLGSAAGGAAGYEMGNGDAAATVGGAAAGAALTHLALGRDKAVLQDGFNQGYVQGQSDAIKRQYFLRQTMERRPLAEHVEGSERTYYVPAPSDEAMHGKTEPAYLGIHVVE